MTAKRVQWKNIDGAMTAIIDGYFVHIELNMNDTFVVRIFWENDIKRAEESAAYRKFLKPVAVGRKKHNMSPMLFSGRTSVLPSWLSSERKGVRDD